MSFQLYRLLLIAAPAAGLLGAMFAQHGLGWLPCPLCILQRLAFIVCLASAWRAASGKQGVYLVGVAFGLSVAVYHSYLTLQPPVSECARGLGYYLWQAAEAAPMLAWLIEAEGSCQEASYAILGIPLPFFGIGLFGAMAIAALLRPANP